MNTIKLSSTTTGNTLFFQGLLNRNMIYTSNSLVFQSVLERYLWWILGIMSSEIYDNACDFFNILPNNGHDQIELCSIYKRLLLW